MEGQFSHLWSITICFEWLRSFISQYLICYSTIEMQGCTQKVPDLCRFDFYLRWIRCDEWMSGSFEVSKHYLSFPSYFDHSIDAIAWCIHLKMNLYLNHEIGMKSQFAAEDDATIL